MWYVPPMLNKSKVEITACSVISFSCVCFPLVAASVSSSFFSLFKASSTRHVAEVWNPLNAVRVLGRTLELTFADPARTGAARRRARVATNGDKHAGFNIACEAGTFTIES